MVYLYKTLSGANSMEETIEWESGFVYSKIPLNIDEYNSICERLNDDDCSYEENLIRENELGYLYVGLVPKTDINVLKKYCEIDEIDQATVDILVQNLKTLFEDSDDGYEEDDDEI